MPTTQTSIVDTDDQFDWDQITSTFNDAGVLTQRLTDFDNGNTKQEYFDGVTGAPQVIIEKDLADAENWTQIFSSIDAWGTTTKTTSFDNGVTREERIQPALSEEAPAYVSSRTEYDDGAAFGWATRGYTYNFFGDLTDSYVRYDTGIIDNRSFQNGIMTSRTQLDTGDAATWDSIETSYDEGGNVADRLDRYDNGIVKYDTFENGVRTSTYQGDNIDESTGAAPEDGGAKNWETIETSYDEGGNVADRLIRYDNGIVKYDTFENGVRTSSYQGDNIDESTGAAPEDGGAKNWETIETSYDEGGNVADRLVRYDNGIVKYDTFENGVRTSSYQGDNIDESTGAAPEDGGAKNWETIETFYDEGGNIADRVIRYDNGSTTQTLYEDGARSLRLQEDVEDVFVWKAIVTEYDADGKVSMKGTEYDNEDATVWLYVEQALQTRIEADRDGSDPWGARLTEYQSGEASVTLYDDVTDLPDPYWSYFDVVASY